MFDAVSYAIDKTFEHQGINLSAIINGKDVFDDIRTYDFVRDNVLATTIAKGRQAVVFDCASTVIRALFYSGNAAEREHLVRLCKLHCLEFVIKGNSSVTRYFKSMLRQLKLYVGADVIVRALSEACVVPESQGTQNAFKLLRQTGARLFLTQKVLAEVHSHIRASHLEFNAQYRSWEHHATLEATKQSDRIMIRAYFYARLEPTRHARQPKNWEQFLGYMGGAEIFESDTGREDFAAYLIKQYGFEFVSEEDVEDACSQARVQKLAALFEDTRKNAKLAYNDAYMMLYIIELRRRNQERFSDNIYGYQTWWLTEEFKTLQVAREAGIKDRVKMHPQFLMNLLLVSPDMREVTQNAKTLFPLTFGLKITRRVSHETLHKFLDQANEAVASDEAASVTRIRSAANKLMSRSPLDDSA